MQENGTLFSQKRETKFKYFRICNVFYNLAVKNYWVLVGTFLSKPVAVMPGFMAKFGNNFLNRAHNLSVPTRRHGPRKPLHQHFKVGHEVAPHNLH
jgi:hypothetical protein